MPAYSIAISAPVTSPGMVTCRAYPSVRHPTRGGPVKAWDIMATPRYMR